MAHEGIVQTEEDLGVLGPLVSETDMRRIIESEQARYDQEQARRELYAKMAANMIINGPHRNSYFVREPGL